MDVQGLVGIICGIFGSFGRLLFLAFAIIHHKRYEDFRERKTTLLQLIGRCLSLNGSLRKASSFSLDKH